MTNASLFQSLIHPIRSALILLLVGLGNACAESSLPEGTIGWWYFTGIMSPIRYTTDPVTACQKGAWNHTKQPLVEMRPYKDRRDMFLCYYSLRPGGSVRWYGEANLHCKPGYRTYGQGFCRKAGLERPTPLKCGEAAGNPVQFMSGAKIQHETDLGGGANDVLSVQRTYRSVRDSGAGQSAGVGWSFSFERVFSAPKDSTGKTRAIVTGALSDGSTFEFRRQGDGTYKSSYDRSTTLEVQGPDDAIWLVTTPDGIVERYLRIDDDFRLSSVHTRTGTATHYTYDVKNQLSKIVDKSGRSLTIAWDGDVIVLISSASGSVRYEYERTVIQGYPAIAGTARLIGVHYLDRFGIETSSRTYHYEDPNDRFLLTGITDEHGKRFATYAYNGDGQAVLTEHADGAQRYTFAYPSHTSRIVTDPLGSSRSIDLGFDVNRSTRRIVGESQPA
ncbi:DUF6531 domain-containing protein, partial [Massilia sp. CCM 9210]|uniref:DUF6531 domain-containing protein n=1 Tax=Massilia scottii TaxID=3057166 RepID=UPI0027965FEF